MDFTPNETIARVDIGELAIHRFAMNRASATASVEIFETLG